MPTTSMAHMANPAATTANAFHGDGPQMECTEQHSSSGEGEEEELVDLLLVLFEFVLPGLLRLWQSVEDNVDSRRWSSTCNKTERYYCR